MKILLLLAGVLVACFLYLPVSADPSLDSSDIPSMNVSNGSNPAPGHIFTALKTGKQSHLFVFDSEGIPVFYRKFPHFIENVQPWPDGIISYYDFKARAYILLDNKQEILDTVEMKNGYKSDFHDFIRLPSGHTILMSIDLKSVDMSQVVDSGQSDATLSGLVIQELDDSGELIFQWSSWDHIDFTDSYADLSAQYIDYIHPNSFWVDTDSTLIVSCRNTSEIFKINRNNSQMIWRMGGKNDEFTRIDDPKGFTGQHAVTRLENGNLLLFDNSIDLENDPWLVKPVDPKKSGELLLADENSRGVEYELSESGKTISLRKEFRHNPQYKANNMGYIQRLSNGNTLMSWGSAATQPGMDISEYDEEGELAFEAGIENNTAQFYKVYKYPFKTELFTLSEDSLDFGELFTGESDSLELIIHNPGTEDLRITSILCDHPSFFISSGTSLPLLIEPGSDYSLSVGFHAIEAGILKEIITLCSETDTSRIASQVYLSGIGKNHVGTWNSEFVEVNIFPNPTDGPILISGIVQGAQVRVYNVFGQLLLEEPVVNHELHINLSQFLRGTYIIEVLSAPGNKITRSIILL